jgi:aryl-alcohol dehydrogenase-like predicted oxidoreductase
MRPGPNGAGLSRKAILTEIDHSLRRLGTDYVDLYQIHRLDNATPIEETLEALHDVVKARKARYLGASSMPAWQFSKALHLQQRYGWARFVSMQDHYNLLAREEEREMLPLCGDKGVGTIVWSPLARGRLARDSETVTGRSGSDPMADMLYPQQASDAAIIKAAAIAKARGSAGRRSRWPGCGVTLSSSPRSSAPASPRTSTTPSPPSTSTSPMTR